MSLVPRFVLPLLVLSVWLSSAVVLGDTVFLKNGAYIDGTVRSRSEQTVEVEIGRLGKIEIAVEDIYEIEKNNRTGDENERKRDKGEQDRIERLTRDGKRKTQKEASPLSKDEVTGEGLEAVELGGDGGSDEAVQELDPELKASIEQLVADLQRQKTRFRTRAERHLRAIGAPSVPFLIPLASNDSDLTRISVLRLLSEFGDDAAVEVCIVALLDGNEYVRDYANKALKRITGEDFGYQPQASPRWREVSQQKWQKWWDDEKAALEDVRKLSGKPSASEG